MQPNEQVSYYKDTERVKTIVQCINQDKTCNPIQLTGLYGSLDALLVAAVGAKTKKLQVILLEDQESSWAIYGDLRNLLSNDKVAFFPSIDHKSNPEHIKFCQNRRLETIYSLLQEQSITVVVTHIEALIDKIPSRSPEQSFTLYRGQKLNLSWFVNLLQEHHLMKVDAVYKKGQFSLHGGIIDVFSAAHPMPYRVEWWGDEISNIRLFNPKDQRSFKSIERAVIAWDQEAPDQSDQYISFATLWPQDSILWIHNKAQGLENLQKAIACDTPANPSHSREDQASLLASFAPYHQIEFGTVNPTSSGLSLHYDCEPQPTFKRNLNKLLEDLQAREKDGYKAFITALSPSQFTRLDTLCDRSNNPMLFTPVLSGLRQGYIDHTSKVVCYTGHQIFDKYYREQTPNEETTWSKEQITQALKDLRTGDYIVHCDYGIGRFAGLHTLQIKNKQQEVVRLVYKNNDVVFVDVSELYKITKYSSKDDTPPVIHKLGTSAWKKKKQSIKKQIKDIAKSLITLYAERKKNIGFPFSKNHTLEDELAASFPYEETPDQALAIEAVRADMERDYPMDRLICGDVGFGKTEIAIRAAFKATLDHKQVAVLVPTTILAVQHYNSFAARLSDFGIRINYLSRCKTKKEIDQIKSDLAEGKIDILIGTHKLLSKSIKFKDLGLLVIDEEQKFGVSAKEALKQIQHHVDSLTLTATPIPRTLNFSLMGARDLSILNTPPINRHPIKTILRTFDFDIIQAAIEHELARHGQVLFIHNKISTIHQMAEELSSKLPTVRICVAHGQMHSNALEDKILNFIAGKYDLLIATNIIESGLDISNANTIIINDSHLFGLADLHQMRGRVGRADTKAFCYLLIPVDATITKQAKFRLQALEEFSDLGDGFNIAMRDLDIRGTGDLLGAAQSGFIADVGFDTYCSLLQEAVQEVKSDDFKSLFPHADTITTSPCSIESDCDAYIPVEYVESSIQRLGLYKRIHKMEDRAQLLDFKEELVDRFGLLPQPLENLCTILELRWQAKRIGIHKLILKDRVLHCHMDYQLVKRHPKTLDAILEYIGANNKTCKLQELSNNLILTISGTFPNLESIREPLDQLERLIY